MQLYLFHAPKHTIVHVATAESDQSQNIHSSIKKIDASNENMARIFIFIYMFPHPSHEALEEILDTQKFVPAENTSTILHLWKWQWSFILVTMSQGSSWADVPYW